MSLLPIIATLGHSASTGGGTGGTGGTGGGTGGTGGGASTTFPWTAGIVGVGDSITAASPSWFELVNTTKAVSGTKYASPGQGMAWACTTLFTNLALTQSVPLATFIGFNDTRVSSGQAVRYEHVKAGTRALAAMQFASHVEMCYSGNTNMAFSSGASDASSSFITSWRSRAQWFINNGTPGASFFLRGSSILNETITFSLTGTNVVIGTFGFSSAHPASRFKVTIDGVDKLTYDPNNRTDEAIAQVINDAIVILGLTNTTHTVVITFLDSGVLSGVDWVGTLKAPAACATIPMYLLDLPHMVDAPSIGYNYPGLVTTQAILDACTTARNTDLQTVFPGYPFCFVDINATGYYLPNSTNTQSDGIHPTTPGHQLIANRVLYYTT